MSSYPLTLLACCPGLEDLEEKVGLLRMGPW